MAAMRLAYPLSRFWPLFALVLGTIPFVIFPIDLAVSALFFDPTAPEGERWFLADHPVVVFLYRYAEGIGLAPAIAGLFGLILAPCWSPARKRWRKCAFLAGVMVLGPGLFVNVFTKEYYGRARPVNISYFQGAKNDSYSPPWVVSEPRQGKSFCSGHAAMGFYLASISLVFRLSLPLVARWIYCFGMLWGSAVAFGRIAQGGHFLSDVIWGGASIYLACLVLEPLLKPGEPEKYG